MKFGPVPVSRAAGAILAHSVALKSGRLRKGLVLDAGHVALLMSEGRDEVIVARLDPGDMDENAAAARLARELVPDPGSARLRITPAFTGRVNLIAQTAGVACLDTEALNRFNRVHPMITVATVPQYQQMAAGQMVATIKIISYAVPGDAVAQASDEARAAIRLAVPVFRSAGLVITEIRRGQISEERGVRAISGRLAALGMTLAETVTVAHRAADLAGALTDIGGDMVLVLTGSATSDPGDVGPSAVRQANGTVSRFGMPVDPGNLLFHGNLGERPVIGLPGCARSPALNGADWVLSRIACGIAVTGDDIAAMGVGGLLKEIPTRPQPRGSNPHVSAASERVINAPGSEE